MTDPHPGDAASRVNAPACNVRRPTRILCRPACSLSILRGSVAEITRHEQRPYEHVGRHVTLLQPSADDTASADELYRQHRAGDVLQSAETER